MAYEFTKLSEVELLESVPDNASAFVEVDGTVKRVPGSGLGGGGGIKTAIIKSSDYDSTVSGLQTLAVHGKPTVTYECTNMTFEEAYGIMASGEPLAVMFMLVGEGATNLYGFTAFVGDSLFGEPSILLSEQISNTIYYWTASGLSTTAPSSGN